MYMTVWFRSLTIALLSIIQSRSHKVQLFFEKVQFQQNSIDCKFLTVENFDESGLGKV